MRFLLLVLAAPALHAQSFEGVGVLPGDQFSSALAVSADGRVVVGQSSGSTGGPQAFRWTEAGGMQGLGDLPGGILSSVARGVSADGSVIVGDGTSPETQAFRWTEAGGMEGLGFLGGTMSTATGVSADGSVIVGRGRNGNQDVEAFRWTEAGGMQGLGDLPGGSFNSSASAASADGSVVVGGSITNPDNDQAFRWTAGGMVALGFLPGDTESTAYDVSDDGTVIIGRSVGPDGLEAFRWTAGGGMQSLGDLPNGTGTRVALGTSADGSVIVGYGSTSTGSEAFIWTAEDGMQALQTVLENAGLDLDGWVLSRATGVSADGSVIVGFGLSPSGITEGWRANLNPSAQWIGTIPYPYTEPDAWSTEEAPDAGYTVAFEDPNDQFSSAPTFFEDATARAAVVNDAASFDLNSFTYTLDSPGTLTIGSVADLPASLLVQDGTFTVGDAILGTAPRPTRAVLDVGLGANTATLTAGLMTVSRTDSAAVSVQTGSTVTLRDGLWIGEAAGSDGEVAVFGGLLQVTESSLGTLIGDEGRGSLWIGDGGLLSLVGTVDIGSSASGNGLLTITDGASGTTLGTLWIGNQGTGGLDVTAGGALTSAAAVLGGESGSFGTVLVDGTGSVWQVQDLIIGSDGAGLLTLTNGSTLIATTHVFIGPQGNTNASGGTVCIGASCGVSKTAHPGGPLLATPALTLADAAQLDAATVLLEDGGTLGGNGALALPLTNAGTLDPGGPGTAGRFTVGADYGQSGTLALDLGGLAPGTGHDQLSVSGAATLGGTLVISLVDGTLPTVGDAYTVLTATSVTGSFDSVSLPEGIEAEIAVSASAVTLTVTGVTVATESTPTAEIALTVAPNPARGSVRLGYALDTPGEIRLTLHDALGREVALLASGPRRAGSHEVTADLAHLPTGVYLARLRASGGAQTQMLTLVR